MRFLIIGDLHGNKPIIHYKNFDAIIAPGDFCSDAPRKYMFQVMKEQMKNPSFNKEWYDLVGKRKARKMIQKSLSDGRRILKFLNSFGVPVYIVPGNWDWTGNRGGWKFADKNYYRNLIKGLRNIKDVHHRILDIGNYQMIGYGISSGPEYPQDKEERKGAKPSALKKMKKNYKKLYNKVGNLFKKRKKSTIFLSHNVPFNTKLDKITDKNSPKYGYHYGSLITRKIIDKYQPLVCIGGHMHEHFGKDKIGKTVIVNSGFGSYVNVLLEISGDKIKKLKFHKSR